MAKVPKNGMTPEQRAEIDAALQRYGARLVDGDLIGAKGTRRY